MRFFLSILATLLLCSALCHAQPPTVASIAQPSHYLSLAEIIAYLQAGYDGYEVAVAIRAGGTTAVADDATVARLRAFPNGQAVVTALPAPKLLTYEQILSWLQRGYDGKDVAALIAAQRCTGFPSEDAVAELLSFPNGEAVTAAMARYTVRTAKEPAAVATVAGVPAAVLAQIRADAERQHPGDYSTQLYVIKRQLAAYRELHP